MTAIIMVDCKGHFVLYFSPHNCLPKLLTRLYNIGPGENT
uniref:Uncharacterized protein n=1 Tax=Arundo donax TaxID=35708 RepID=A0A0A8ZZU0_ARUDO